MREGIYVVLAWLFAVICAALGAFCLANEAVTASIPAFAAAVLVMPALYKVWKAYTRISSRRTCAMLSIALFWVAATLAPPVVANVTPEISVNVSNETGGIYDAASGAYMTEEGAIRNDNDCLQISSPSVMTPAPVAERCEATGENGLTVHFLDVGQADCTLVQCDGHSVLIDAGSWDSYPMVFEYLRGLGITSLDHVIATHPHADHIGGMSNIIRDFDVKQFLLPDIEGKNASYEQMRKALNGRGTSTTFAAAGLSYSMGKGKLEILGPLSVPAHGTDVDDTAINNCSVVVRIDYDNISVLFMGDAQEEEELGLLKRDAKSLSADVLKVGHHGASNSTNPLFCAKVAPKYAVISCGADNQYGHPHKETIMTLLICGAKAYRTDKNGTIVLEYNGGNFEWSVER